MTFFGRFVILLFLSRRQFEDLMRLSYAGFNKLKISQLTLKKI